MNRELGVEVGVFSNVVEAVVVDGKKSFVVVLVGPKCYVHVVLE